MKLEAILLRKSNTVNKVASPKKFSEYINCNLPVFISHNIGDIDEMNSKYNICIYDYYDFIHYFMGLMITLFM